MLAFSDIPPPESTTTVALLGLACVLWVFLRVQLLRRQLARDAGDGQVTQIGFLHKLARAPWTYPLLAVLALGFAALLWWSLR